MTKRDLLIDFLGWYQRNTQEEGTENEKWMDEQTVDSYLNQPNGSNIVLAVSGPTEQEISTAAHRIVQLYINENTPTLTYVKMKHIFKDAVEWHKQFQAACATAKGGPAEE